MSMNVLPTKVYSIISFVNVLIANLTNFVIAKVTMLITSNIITIFAIDFGTVIRDKAAICFHYFSTF